MQFRIAKNVSMVRISQEGGIVDEN